MLDNTATFEYCQE